MSHPLFKNYPQAIDTRDIKKTLLQFEVQIMFGGKGQNITYDHGVVLVVDMGGDSYIVNVNMDGSTKEFVLSYTGAKNVVHHLLEGGRWVGEAKEHDSWFVGSISHFEGSFMFIAFFDADIVVTPLNVQLCVNVSTM